MYKSNTASFVVSLLVHKMRGGEGALIRRGLSRGAYFKFRQWEGRLFERGAYSNVALIRRGSYSKGRLFEGGLLFEGALIRGGAYSRICGNLIRYNSFLYPLLK